MNWHHFSLLYVVHIHLTNVSDFSPGLNFVDGTFCDTCADFTLSKRSV